VVHLSQLVSLVTQLKGILDTQMRWFWFSTAADVDISDRFGLERRRTTTDDGWRMTGGRWQMADA
jgi:hypothetical protein